MRLCRRAISSTQPHDACHGRVPHIHRTSSHPPTHPQTCLFQPGLQVAAELPVTAGASDARTMAAAAAAAAVVREAAAAAVAEHLEGESGALEGAYVTRALPWCCRLLGRVLPPCASSCCSCCDTACLLKTRLQRQIGSCASPPLARPCSRGAGAQGRRGQEAAHAQGHHVSGPLEVG